MNERQCVDCREMVDISDLTEEIESLKGELECTKIVYDKEYLALYVKELRAEVERLSQLAEMQHETIGDQIIVIRTLRARLEKAVEPGKHRWAAMALNNYYSNQSLTKFDRKRVEDFIAKLRGEG